MNRRRVLRRRIVVGVLLLLSVALLTLYVRESDSGFAHTVEGGVMRVVTPLQTGTARVAKPFRDGWNWVADLFSAKAENKKLKKEVETLRAAVAQELTTQSENSQLRRMQELKDNLVFPKGAELVTGRVIGRSTQVWYSTVTINVGSDKGVGVYDPVVNGAGLVGRVTKVNATAAEVTLITDQKSYVEAMVVPGTRKGLGTAQGVLGGSVTGDVTLQYVDKSEKVKVGEWVVTSGRDSTAFVRGIPVGRVTSVGNQDVELYQNIAVRPFVDFHKLDLVQVVVK